MQNKLLDLVQFFKTKKGYYEELDSYLENLGQGIHKIEGFEIEGFVALFELLEFVQNFCSFFRHLFLFWSVFNN